MVWIDPHRLVAGVVALGITLLCSARYGKVGIGQA